MEIHSSCDNESPRPVNKTRGACCSLKRVIFIANTVSEIKNLYLVFYHLLTVTNWTTKNCMSHSVVKEQLGQFAVHHLFSCAVLIGP